MITPTVKIDDSNIKVELAALAAIPKQVQAAGKKTVEVIGSKFLAQVRTYPPPAVLPFGFATQRSKNWYFAAIHGLIPGVTIPTSGGRYARTGKLANSFYVRTVTEKGTFLIEFGTSMLAALYVIGTFDGKRKTQVPGHRTTGWPDIFPVVNLAADDAIDFFAKEIGSQYANFKLGKVS